MKGIVKLMMKPPRKMQPLSDNELHRLLNFIGYGRLQSAVWFIGMEEGGAGVDTIRGRLKFKKIEDCADAHRILGIEKFHWGKRRIQSTWRGMCCIMLGLDGRATTKENIRRYQAESLGRIHGRILLTELMPLPKPGIDHWGYNELIPQYASSEEYYNDVKPRRILLLRQLVKKHKPAVIICYGKKYWPNFKTIFSKSSFKTIGQFEIAKEDGNLIILTHHFAQKTMNGKFDKVVSIIKTHNAK